MSGGQPRPFFAHSQNNLLSDAVSCDPYSVQEKTKYRRSPNTSVQRRATACDTRNRIEKALAIIRFIIVTPTIEASDHGTHLPRGSPLPFLSLYAFPGDSSKTSLHPLPASTGPDGTAIRIPDVSTGAAGPVPAPVGNS